MHREVFEHLLMMLESHSEETQPVLKAPDMDEIFCYIVNSFGLLLQSKSRTVLGTLR